MAISNSSPRAQSLSDKEHISHLEDGTKQEQTPSVRQVVYNPDVDVSGIDERKLMRKVDSRTIPWLALLYLLAFLDRTSIGNAKVGVALPWHPRLLTDDTVV